MKLYLNFYADLGIRKTIFIFLVSGNLDFHPKNVHNIDRWLLNMRGMVPNCRNLALEATIVPQLHFCSTMSIKTKLKISLLGVVVVVVKWSACSPSTPTIRARILLSSTVFSVKFVFEINENNQKEAGDGPFKTILYLGLWRQNCD